MDLYSKSGLTLPYLKDTEIERWYEEGQQKIKYTRIWLVLGTEANEFIENLDRSYNDKNLTSVSRNDMGGLCEVSAVYGERYWDDGQQEWYTVSGGRITHHLSRWVTNSPSAIKSFCNYAIGRAIYKDGVSVSCSPISGEPKVLCEASWDAQDEDELEEDDGSGDSGDGGFDDGDDDEEEGDGEEEGDIIKETSEAVQFSSTTESLTIDRKTIEENDPDILGSPKALEVLALLEAGQVAWQDSKSNSLITKSGWYRVTNNTLSFKEGPVVDDDSLTPEKINKIKSKLDNPPTFIFPVIRCSITSKIESGDNFTVNHMTGDMSSVGMKQQTILAGGTGIAAPQFMPTNTTDSTYQFETFWVYEGSSFDQSQNFQKIDKKGTLVFVGTQTASYRTVTQIQGKIQVVK